MANLYELSDVFKDIYEKIEMIENMDFDTDTDGNIIDGYGNVIENPDEYKTSLLEAWCNSIDDLKITFDEKAEWLAVCIKNLKADADKIAAEEKALKERKQAKERELSRMKDYLYSSMRNAGIEKIDMPKAKVSIRNNADSLVIDDEMGFVAWAQEHNDSLLKYSMPEIRKNDVKKVLKTEAIPFVHLERSQSLIIK